jgi:hypothetical protein
MDLNRAMFSAKTVPNHDDFKRSMEKTPHNKTNCRHSPQTDFPNRGQQQLKRLPDFRIVICK